MATIYLKNTLSGEKEIFNSLQPSCVRMYVCGITPYDYAHVGHGRCYVTFDVVYRLLTTQGYNVTYVRNFTDIDDKLLVRAQKEYGDQTRYLEIAQRYIDAYHVDMHRLNCMSPAHEPRVTQVIPEIISFIEALIESGHAYEANGSVYFAVHSFKSYCKLSRRNLDELIAGARVEVNDEKRDPLDFALWKAEEGDAFWHSPWGHGRPGWHIECSVMAQKFLGDKIDIHGGGMDLIFPHHENEIAQSESHCGHTWVRYWLHNAFVRIDKEKMSKSLGNFFTLRDVFEKYDPMVVRFMILNHHYRSPLDFSFTDLDVAQKTYQRLCKLFEHTYYDASEPIKEENVLIAQMMDFLRDDLNTPGMWGIVFEHFRQLQENEDDRIAVKKVLMDVLGLTLVPLPEKEVEITPEIQTLLEERAKARAAKDWAKSDILRDQLKALGYEVRDSKTK